MFQYQRDSLQFACAMIGKEIESIDNIIIKFDESIMSKHVRETNNTYIIGIRERREVLKNHYKNLLYLSEEE